MKEEDFMMTLCKAVSSFGSASRMTSLLMYQTLSDGLRESGYHSVIVGEGADEIFWGYSRHVSLWHRRNTITVDDFASAWFGAYEKNAMVFNKSVQQELCELIKDLTRDHLSKGFEDAVKNFDLNYSLEPLLRRSDHLLMSSTIEARTPFLHAGLPYSIPFDQLIRGNQGKSNIYELLKKRLPSWKSSQKKHFRAPLCEWREAQRKMRLHLRNNLEFLEEAGLTEISNSYISNAPPTNFLH